MNVKRVVALCVVAALAVAGLYFGLGPGGAPQVSVVEQTGQQQKDSEPLTLRLGVVTLPPALGNPYRGTGFPTIYTFRAMFEGLTALSEEGVVQPRLATSWQRVDDLTWQFDLRRNVVFHNGEPFTADAVVFAVDYLTSDEGRIESVARDLGIVASAEAVDDYSVLIRSHTPAPLLPALMESLLIVEPGQWTRLGPEGFAFEPVGTGPFKLVEWGETTARLTAHTEGWRPPKVDALEILQLPDQSTRVQAILSERADIVIALSYDDTLTLEASIGKGMVLKNAGVLGVSIIFPQLSPNHPLQDVRVRQALNYAVDKQAYIDAFFGGHTQPASQPTVPGVFGYDESVKPYPHDPDRARALLTEAGYPDGFTFTAEVSVGGGASLAEAYQRVAADLLKVGVVMTLQTIPVPQLIRGIQEGDWRGEAFGMNFGAERTGDALRPLRLHSCIIRNPWYCNKTVDQMINAALQESDIDKRRALSEDIMRYYHEQAPTIYMHEIVAFSGLGPRVKNFREDYGVIAYDEIELEP